MTKQNRSSRYSRGYSLAEMLTVVAIVGIISLVTVPNFIQYYRSAKMKTSLNHFATEVRRARGQAVTLNRRMLVTVKAGGRDFYVSMWNPATSVYDLKSSYQLEDTVYFDSANTSFTNLTTVVGVDDSPATPQPDVMFYPNGTVGNLPATGTAQIVLKTDQDIPKTSYNVELSAAGQVKVR